MSESKVLKSKDFHWQGVDLREYKQAGAGERFRGVTRQTLLGEGHGEGELNFLTRYFEVEPGRFSSLEMHRHPHVVVVLRGRGEVVLDSQTFAIEPFDCVYVSPDTPHQFRAGGGAPLGFLCVVDRDRDRPRVVDG